MPGYDGTGPAGWGPMSGGGRGVCRGSGSQGQRRWMGRSGRTGRGMCAGRGWGAGPFPAGRMPAASISVDEELDMLRAESEEMQRTLAAIRKRMDALMKTDAPEPASS